MMMYICSSEASYTHRGGVRPEEGSERRRRARFENGPSEALIKKPKSEGVPWETTSR